MFSVKSLHDRHKIPILTEPGVEIHPGFYHGAISGHADQGKGTLSIYF